MEKGSSDDERDLLPLDDIMDDREGQFSKFVRGELLIEIDRVDEVVGSVAFSSFSLAVMKPLVIALTGPTCSGKTALSLKLARSLNAEIISADSIQNFRGLDIGSCKVTPKEKGDTPHHLIDSINLNEKFSSYKFRKLALPIVHDIIERKKVPLIVGGSFFHLQFLLANIDDSQLPPTRSESTDDLEIFLKSKGWDASFKLLLDLDPNPLDISTNNFRRLAREIEAAQAGNPISTFKRPIIELPDPRFDIRVISTKVTPREDLYRNIDSRCELLTLSGIIQETARLMASGQLVKGSQASLAIGYKESIDLIEKGWPSGISKAMFTAFLNEFRSSTRQFARRQQNMIKQQKDSLYYLEVGTDPRDPRVFSDLAELCSVSEEEYLARVKGQPEHSKSESLRSYISQTTLIDSNKALIFVSTLNRDLRAILKGYGRSAGMDRWPQKEERKLGSEKREDVPRH
eukprot:TRINITY_DN6703_c0_g1_i1.p1 TRINITY_DN6703_c0_g1~~TRINITY_DN6703_c0_g1_i1.p1  ORF type:complete len:459 (+),score=141.50 TRINITY_DN6703_c0_g1_i1:1201-2577(+)